MTIKISNCVVMHGHLSEPKKTKYGEKYSCYLIIEKGPDHMGDRIRDSVKMSVKWKGGTDLQAVIMSKKHVIDCDDPEQRKENKYLCKGFSNCYIIRCNSSKRPDVVNYDDSDNTRCDCEIAIEPYYFKAEYGASVRVVSIDAKNPYPYSLI